VSFSVIEVIIKISVVNGGIWENLLHQLQEDNK